MKEVFMLLFLISVVGGCCDPNNYNSWGYNECGGYNQVYDQRKPPTITYTTKVISEPPGARIELDGDYIGDAPLEIQWDGWSINGLFTKDHEVKALPIYEGQYVQCKFFRGGLVFNDPRDPVPKTILFDMNLAPVPTRYELDIH